MGLNNCEHVAIRDCTANPKVMVTLKKTPAQHIVKAVIDHNKYELELVRGGRGRTTGTLKVNGQVELFCLPKDREGMTMRQMAESGDKIERASSYPTESVAIV